MNAKDEAAIEALRHDVDRTLLRENLKLTLEQRVQKHLRAAQMMEELRRAGIRLRAGQKTDGR
jgi:phage terminase Nu1 subunit (DNA packaging protein)